MRICKSTLLVVSAVVLSGGAVAQNGARPGSSTAGTPQTTGAFLPRAVITEAFDNVGVATAPGANGVCTTSLANWFAKNNSAPVGTTCVFAGGNGTTFPAQAGAATSYAAMNFNSTGTVGNISTWLVTPRVNFGTGASLSFFFRSGNTVAANFADRIQVRLSSAADTGTPDVGATATDVGTFTTLLADINPTLATAFVTCPAGGFALTAPNSTIAGTVDGAWCQVTINNAAGIPTSGSGRIAFRYFVTNGGGDGLNSNFIGIDTFSFDEGTAGGGVVSAVTAPGPVALTQTLPASSTSRAFTFNATGGPATVNCTITGAGYAVTGSPLNLVVGTPGSVNVTYTGSALGTFPGVLTCTAGATQFVYNLSTTVGGAVVQAPSLNVFGALALLIGLGLFGSFAARRFG